LAAVALCCCVPKTGKTTAIDFREMAPEKASRDMFLDEQGNADSKKSLTSPLASGTPGTVAGFSLALEKYGTMPLAKVIQPAYKLARDGYIVNEALADDLKQYGSEVLPGHENSKAIFWKKNGNLLQKGDRLVQANLAKSLELIAENGPDAFYKGPIADQIANEMANSGGLISKADLANYKAVERKPISGEYRGYEVYSMPPPSSGGIHIVQILNILENFDLAKYGFGSADAMQLIAEAEKYAYADRSEYLGDPDFVKVPWQALTSKAYAKSLAEKIDVNKARPSSDIKPGKLAPYESNQTTHFSVVDKDGNAVAVTYTLNTNFGSGIVAGNTGILMNNQMDDFSAKPGVPNVYGLVGGDANAVGPHKRPLSSMSPTIVVKEGKTWLVTGSPGGSRIITTVLQMVINSVDFGMNVAEATNAPRFHHQWLPDELRVEKGFSPDTLKLLAEKGQKVVVKEAMGSTQSIMIAPDGKLYGASDPRTVEDLTEGY
jgi:gamma-glutamyltranspeptidase/glutathione hydrolase